MEEYILKCIKESVDVKYASADAHAANIAKCVEVVVNALSSGKKLLTIGNGGSAGDAQHIAAEFTIRLKQNRKAYPAIALTTDTSALTAIGPSAMTTASGS